MIVHDLQLCRITFPCVVNNSGRYRKRYSKTQFFNFSFFYIFVVELNKDPFAEAKYVICLKIEKANLEIFAFENAKRRSRWPNGQRVGLSRGRPGFDPPCDQKILSLFLLDFSIFINFRLFAKTYFQLLSISYVIRGHKGPEYQIFDVSYLEKREYFDKQY